MSEHIVTIVNQFIQDGQEINVNTESEQGNIQASVDMDVLKNETECEEKGKQSTCLNPINEFDEIRFVEKVHGLYSSYMNGTNNDVNLNTKPNTKFIDNRIKYCSIENLDNVIEFNISSDGSITDISKSPQNSNRLSDTKILSNLPNIIMNENKISKAIATVGKGSGLNNDCVTIAIHDVSSNDKKYRKNSSSNRKAIPLVRKHHNKDNVTWVGFMGGGSGKNENYEDEPLEYDDPESRNRFVRLVFLILFAMLLVTSVCVTVVLVIPRAKIFFLKNYLFCYILAVIIIFSVHYPMMFSSCSRRLPGNVICLCFVTIGMTLLCIAATVHTRTEIILNAFLTTTAVVFVCLLLAFSKFDFTKFLLYIIVILAALCVISLVLTITKLVLKQKLTTLTIGISIASAILQSIMLVIELQMVLGGRSVELNENDYAMGAYLLYSSIITLFLEILRIFQLFDS